MGLFGFGKKDRVLDLTDRYRRQQEKATEIQQDAQEETAVTPFAFFGNTNTPSSESKEVVDLSTGEDRKKKLAKRLMDMTTKMEDLSNQVYHLQQRIEVLERKSGVGSY
ncbi:hypothetical protein KAJ87_00900 [Candidatus Pacearchaeota archaeon]|nr:hypothetical protein [Candidatus Pacearchaeota archaeon]